MTNQRIYLSAPHMGGKELLYIHEAFSSNWISPVGPNISAFEARLAQYVRVNHCAALSSGTAAIHLALSILGVGAGDEVICQSFTFSGSCNPIVYRGALPVFVDSESETWNMDPALLSEAVEDRIRKTGKTPKAIIFVHLYGMPALVKDIVSIGRKFNIPIIEDAAEALGSEYDGQKCGAFGDFGVLSFNGNKIITTSGGGALLSQQADWIQKARFLSTQAREQAPHYEHKEIGYNYRLSNICAGIGLGQLEVIDQRVNRRREIFSYYRQNLEPLLAYEFLNEPLNSLSNRWLTTTTVNAGWNTDREKLRVLLEEHNIESRPLWKPMHMQPVFKNCPFYGSGTSEQLFETGLCLPSGTQLSNQDLDRVIELLRRAVT